MFRDPLYPIAAAAASSSATFLLPPPLYLPAFTPGAYNARQSPRLAPPFLPGALSLFRTYKLVFPLREEFVSGND